MKPQLTVATATAPATAADSGPSAVPQDWLDMAPAIQPVWRHTLILTGTLGPGSTPELQEEIECLYQEGVTSVVLDLRLLDSIEPIGIQAIASLGALYKRRGLMIAVVDGSTFPEQATMDGDAAAVAIAEPAEGMAARRFSRATGVGFPTRSTKMIKEL